MTAPIPLTGLSNSDPRPGVYLQINFGVGDTAGAGVVRSAILIGNKTTAGSATTGTVIYGPDTVTRMQTEADVITLMGAGSPLHRMWRRFVKINKTTPLYAVVVAESAGTAASGTIVIGSGPATATGNIRVWIGDEFVDVGIATSDNATTIGGNIATAINAKTHWPVTANNVSGTVTITAKVKGPRGNWIRFQAILDAGLGVTTTAAADGFLTSGATADSSTTALATIANTRFYYQISEADDSTQVGALVSQTNSNALPMTGIRERVFFGSVDTLANAITAGTTENAARAELVWHKASPFTPAELAANNAALYALGDLASRPRNNYSLFPTDDTDSASWVVPASRDSTAAASSADLLSALNNGITPIATLPNGKTQLVKRVTTRSLNGSTADYRIRDAHKVTICDFFGDDLVAKARNLYGGKDLTDDPDLTKGQRPPAAGVIYPRIVRGGIVRLIDDYGDTTGGSALLQNVDQTKATLNVQREPNTTSRITARIELYPIDIADQFGFVVDQVG